MKGWEGGGLGSGIVITFTFSIDMPINFHSFLLMISNIDLGKMKTFCPKTKLYYKSTSSYFNFGCKHFEIVSSNKIQQRRKDFIDWTIHSKQKATFDIFNGSYNAKFQNSFSKKTSSSSLCWTLIFTFINTNIQIYGTLQHSISRNNWGIDKGLDFLTNHT